METKSSMSRSLHINRDLEKLEPYEGKPSCTVLRGEEGSNALDLPDRPSDLAQRDGRAVRKGNEIAKLYADNKVDVIIYAVEKSLDSYKFNLLHCKQTFISQLKSELATLDRKIQLELAPKHEETPSQGQEQGGGQDLPKAENVPKPDDAARDYIRDHIIIGRPGIPERREGHGMKM